MLSQGKKVFVISLDGATFDVLNPLIAQGYMPNLGKMMSDSVAAELESVVPPVTAPAWTSFMTGKNPNKHGIFDFARFNETEYSWTINNARNIQSKTLWQLLSDKGKRVVVLNLPYTYPPYPINGVMISGWDAPFTEQAFSYPSAAGADVLRRFPDYKNNLWVSEFLPLRSDSQYIEFTNKLRNGFEQQAAIALDMLSQEWDVFMVHFQQTDWIQHKLWKYIEQGCDHPEDHSPKVEATRDCYRHFDSLVGRLMDRVAPFAPTTIVLSDHGFGRLMGNIHPNFHLKQWGYLSLKSETQDQLKGVKSLFRNSKSETVRRMYRSLAETKNSIGKGVGAQDHNSWVDNAGEVLRGRGASWDWTKTKAACIYAYQMGFIYVNMVGRSPKGIVQPGEEYEAIVSDLTSRFKGLLHPGTGEKLLRDVIRNTDIYPAADNGIMVPDLVLIPENNYGFSFSITDAPPVMTEEGTHRHNGVLIIGGDSVRLPTTEFHPNLIDVAPTILHLLDLAVPSDMDGRVLEEILALDRPIHYEDADNSVARVDHNYEQEEAEIVAQRLRGLGYLD